MDGAWLEAHEIQSFMCLEREHAYRKEDQLPRHSKMLYSDSATRQLGIDTTEIHPLWQCCESDEIKSVMWKI